MCNLDFCLTSCCRAKEACTFYSSLFLSHFISLAKRCWPTNNSLGEAPDIKKSILEDGFSPRDFLSVLAYTGSCLICSKLMLLCTTVTESTGNICLLSMKSINRCLSFLTGSDIVDGHGGP